MVAETYYCTNEACAAFGRIADSLNQGTVDLAHPDVILCRACYQPLAAGPSELEPVLKIVRLPDGRWGIENGQGVETLTREDVLKIHDVWMLWADIRWRVLKDQRHEQLP